VVERPLRVGELHERAHGALHHLLGHQRNRAA
jgi:hypothetical protein